MISIQLTNTQHHDNLTSKMALLKTKQPEYNMSSLSPVLLKEQRTKKRKIFFGLIAGLLLITSLSLAFYSYFWILPLRHNNQYESTIQPAYSQQHTEMLSVYKTVNSPAFTSITTSPSVEVQDLTDINATIQQANALTGTLGTDNSLTAWPETERLSSVKRDLHQSILLQQYVNDSETFLNNYLAASTYALQFEHIENFAQLSAFFNSISVIDKSTTAAQLLAASSSSSKDLGSAISAISTINSPSDFQQFNTSQVKQLDDVNNEFIDTIGSINGEDSEQITNTISQLNKDADALHGFSNNNFTTSAKPRDAA